MIFEDYYKMVIYGREDEYTEEDKIQIEKEYEDLRKRYIEYNYYSDKLARLKDFYTIDTVYVNRLFLVFLLCSTYSILLVYEHSGHAFSSKRLYKSRISASLRFRFSVIAV